jgi:hypothetical protein
MVKPIVGMAHLIKVLAVIAWVSSSQAVYGRCAILHG